MPVSTRLGDAPETVTDASLSPRLLESAPIMSDPIDEPGWEPSPLRFDPDRPVEPDLLGRILRQAGRTASPYNLQPWRFLVVRDGANRRRLQNSAWNEPRTGQAPVVVIVLGCHEPDRTHLDAILARRLELGACSPGRAAEIRGRAAAALGRVTDREGWATRAAMLAASALMQSASALGVASALIDDFDSEAVRASFGVPDDHAVCCLIALGRAVEVEPFAGRHELDEICFEEHFGQPWTG